MAAGKLTGMAAFMGGKMKLKGNMALAQKFNSLIEVARKTPPAAAVAAATAPAAAPAAAAAPAGFESAAVFETIRTNLAADPALTKKVHARPTWPAVAICVCLPLETAANQVARTLETCKLRDAVATL